MDQFTKDLTKTLLSNGDVKELFRQQLETAINRILQAELRTCLVSFKNYLQEGQYNHLKTAVKGAFTVFPKSPTFV